MGSQRKDLRFGRGAAPRAQIRGLFVANPLLIEITSVLTFVRDCVEMTGSVIGGATLVRKALMDTSNDKQCLDPGIWILAHLGP